MSDFDYTGLLAYLEKQHKRVVIACDYVMRKKGSTQHEIDDVFQKEAYFRKLIEIVKEIIDNDCSR